MIEDSDYLETCEQIEKLKDALTKCLTFVGAMAMTDGQFHDQESILRMAKKLLRMH